MAEKNPATAQDYQDIFELHKTGAKIFDDLIFRFGGIPSQSNGIDRVLDQERYMGRREIIEFIVLRLNQANGIKSHGETIEMEQDTPR
jgi:hypothetical protein